MADAKDRFCRNCGRGYHRFRTLTNDERDFALEIVDEQDIGEYRRCTNGSCVRVQHYFNARDGFDLPEELR
ncbi:hypothetical protein ACIRL3_20245 [Streptomyces sp. NPDC102384]|uniref:hypothetical protein n=1 Tax=unclassified Streptomyces TaxID=2593676 RepID=UPI0038034898